MLGLRKDEEEACLSPQAQVGLLVILLVAIGNVFAEVLQIRFTLLYFFVFLGKCFLYCNGLMDHVYVCQNMSSCSSWYKTPTHFSGTVVTIYLHFYKL